MSLAPSFNYWLKMIDLFGVQIKVNFQKDETYSTRLGQAFSLGIILFHFILFIALVVDMRAYDKPNLVTKATQTAYTDKSSLDNLYTAFRLELRSGAGIIQDIQTLNHPVTIQGCVRFENYTTNCIQEEWKKSEGVQFLYDWKRLYSLTQKQDPSLIRDIYLAVNLGDCSQNCAKSKQFFQNDFWISLQVSSQNLDYSDFNNPFKNDTILIERENIAKSQFRLQMSRVKIISETAPFFFNPTVVSTQGMTLKESSIYADTNFSFQIHIDPFLVQTTRTYSNLLTVLAQLIGVLLTLHFIIRLIIQPFTNYALKISILDQVFAFDTTPPEQLNTSKNNFYTSGQASLHSPIRKKNEEQKEQIIQDFNSRRTKQLEFNFCDYLTVGLYGDKRDLVDQALEKLNKQFDVTLIIEKLFELEKLKHILLNESQLKLFEYMPKPLITYQTQQFQVVPLRRIRTQIQFFSEEKQSLKQIESALKAYQEVRTQDTLLNRRLVEFMDPESKDFFEDLVNVNLRSPEQTNGQMEKSQSFPRVITWDMGGIGKSMIRNVMHTDSIRLNGHEIVDIS